VSPEAAEEHSALPAPTLIPEWRAVLCLSDGTEVAELADSEEAALAICSRYRHSTWKVEMRLCSPWAAVGPPRRNRLIVEEVEGERNLGP
jgi:hypothetical protein